MELHRSAGLSINGFGYLGATPSLSLHSLENDID
jgi:hypothetical protein